MENKKGFTLIELLIVVAIIAILAAIAVPNFLEAQVRAKVARVQSDLRSIGTALESYMVDNNDYPPNNFTLRWNTPPIELSTPVAYLSTVTLLDPFPAFAEKQSGGIYVYYYTYHMMLTFDEAMNIYNTTGENNSADYIDYPGYNEGCFEKYGLWRLLSAGPDLTIGATYVDSDILYDPTNGTISGGNIVRTQKSVTGVINYNP